jgi:hypothetical protein
MEGMQYDGLFLSNKEQNKNFPNNFSCSFPSTKYHQT